jgi:N5-(cytidine 5'-diphosphoramidyl)-L-glutamine hydrolase
MKSVAVSQHVEVWKGRNERRDGVDQRLLDWIVKAGFVPFPVPNSLSNNLLEKWLARLCPSSILLSGGNNIGEAPERDRTEAQLLAYANYHKLPVLGICRGMQFLAHYAGANLERLNGHVSTRHEIIPTMNINGNFPVEVNSYHDWGLVNLPSEYKVLAHTTQDGSIEAISHNFLPWEGWMWHPERDPSFCDIQLNRLNDLFRR